MYGHSARQTLMAVLKEAPELKIGAFPNTKGKLGAPTDSILRQLTDRVLLELWMRGFSVSARDNQKDKPPAPVVDHDAWRSSKRATAGA